MTMVKLVEYADATPEVRAVYDDIMATRKVDWINNIWKALATHPPTRITSRTGPLPRPGYFMACGYSVSFGPLSVPSDTNTCKTKPKRTVAANGCHRRSYLPPPNHLENRATAETWVFYGVWVLSIVWAFVSAFRYRPEQWPASPEEWLTAAGLAGRVGASPVADRAGRRAWRLRLDDDTALHCDLRRLVDDPAARTMARLARRMADRSRPGWPRWRKSCRRSCWSQNA